MKTENSKNEKLERKQTVLFQVGLVLSLSLVLLAFEWKTPKSAPKLPDNFRKENFEADFTTITVQKDKPVMPLPKKAQVFTVIDNKARIDETLEIRFENTEDGVNNPDLHVDFKIEEIVVEDTAIYDYPSSYPEFQGGESAFFKYLGENLRYTEEAKGINLEGTIYVLFVVWKDGSIRDAQILRGLGAGLDEEVIRVIGAMPDWKPGLQNGRPVNVRYRVPVTFNLN